MFRVIKYRLIMHRPAIRVFSVLLLVGLVVIGVKLGTIIHFPGVFSFSKFSERDSVGDEKLLLPPIDILQTLNISELVSLMHRYTNTYQVLCRNQLRVGTVFDGGKEVCIDGPVAPKTPCLVYSFGSHNEFDFEAAVIHWFGCEVHTFDPSMGTLSWAKIKNPPGCTFHHFGLGSKDTTINGNWTIRTLGTTMKDLRHEHFDQHKLGRDKSGHDKLEQNDVGQENDSKNKLGRDKSGHDKLEQNDVGQENDSKNKLGRDKSGHDKLEQNDVGQENDSKNKLGRDIVGKDINNSNKLGRDNIEHYTRRLNTIRLSFG